MGFLHKLWDETLAGPTPDSGLSKLRNFHSSQHPISPIISDLRLFSSDSHLLTLRTPIWDLEKFVREKSSVQSPGATTPTEFYWVMISALDR